MAGFTTTSNDHLIRSQLWTTQLKKVFEDELMGTQYVQMLTEFPDGDTFNIPSLGQMETFDYAEGQAVRYTGYDTGNFQFSITDYKGSATYITNKMKQDSYVSSQVVASFVPDMNRALMVAMENDIMAIGPAGQTSADSNTINGAKHRFVGSGASETLAIEDFQKAAYALRKANVPMTNLVAIVSPEVEYSLVTQPNFLNMSCNPRWEGIVNEQSSTGMKFIRNIFGFDVYVSNYLKTNTASETIDGVTAAAGQNNLFFSADSSATPFVGAIRQAPMVDSDYNKDYQRDEYVTTMRYGFKLYRPENLVVVLTDSDQVYA